MLFIPTAISKKLPLFILSGMFASGIAQVFPFFSSSVFLLLDFYILTVQRIPGTEAFREALISFLKL